MNSESTASAIRVTAPGGLLSRIGGRLSWAAMVYLWIIYALNSNMRQWFSIVQPSVVEEFHLTPATMGLYSGLLTAAVGVSGIVFSPLLAGGGRGWARKYRHLPIVLCYGIFSVLTGIGALTTTIAAIFAFQLIKNLASGIGEVAEVTAIAEWWPLERRGFAQGLHHTAFPWGSLIGGLAISAVLGIFGSTHWRYIFLILPFFLLPVFFFYWRFSTKDNYAGFVEDTRARGETPPLAEDEQTHRAPPGAFWRTVRNPNVLVVSIASGFGNFSLYGLGFWLPAYLAFIVHYPLAKVAAYSVLFTITGGIGQIVWGAISDRFGRKLSLVLMFLWLTVAFSLFRFVGVGLGTMIAIQLFAGMATNGIYPVLYAMGSDSCERGTIAIANGLNIGGVILGGLGTVVVGVLIQWGGGYSSPVGFNLSLYFLAGTMALSAIMIALFTRETNGPFIHLDRALVSRESCLRNEYRHSNEQGD
ncbi:MFS transporter [Lichenicola cladoniae]|uniref:MFS transporter n=1 Tax=Lichenicola cladoniae TaxID=1484109 RepID=A0A6M8HHM1_9PROT|nr:MFS transporter [Lichenicola cladoniae]NPD65245.1 MFS transporter [Acetobacteraceae bacterium]QKE88839.1 MFS transporter [Lichenicola cladoniae]